MNSRTTIVCVSFAIAATWAKANLISNGGFESPVQAPNTINPGVTPTDWTGGAFLFNGSNPPIWPSPQEGAQFEDFGFTGFSLSQTFNAPVAGLYTLSWYDNAGIGFPHSYTVDVNGSGTFFPTAIGSPVWVLHTLPVTLNAGANILTFIGGPGADSLVDDVRIEAASVPDAGNTLGLLSMASGAIALLAKRLRR